MELSPKRRSTPSASLAATTSRPMDRSASSNMAVVVEPRCGHKIRIGVLNTFFSRFSISLSYRHRPERTTGAKARRANAEDAGYDWEAIREDDCSRVDFDNDEC